VATLAIPALMLVAIGISGTGSVVRGADNHHWRGRSGRLVPLDSVSEVSAGLVVAAFALYPTHPQRRV
jgi:hypothetical protein